MWDWPLLPRRPIAVAVVALLYAGVATLSIKAAFDETAIEASGRPQVTASEVDQLADGASTETGVAHPAGASDASGAGGSPASSGASGSSPSATTALGGGAAPAPNVRGVTDREIKVGIGLPVRGGAAATVGVQGLEDPGRQSAQAVVDYINAHGGIAGRVVVPVYKEIDNTTGTFAAEAQAACAKWTEDDPVFAALAWGYDRDVMLACLAAKQTPMITESIILYDDELYSRYRGYLYNPSGVRGERLGVWIEELAQSDYFDGPVRTALIRFDTPEHDRASKNVIRPALAKAGVKLVDEVAVKSFTSVAEVSDVGAEAQNAVLRFRSEQVDRVLILDTGGVLTITFTAAAESQQYRPRYGLTSYNYADYVAQNVPAQQLNGAVGVGWQSAGDTGLRDESNAATMECINALRQAGINPLSSGDGMTNQFRFCSMLFFLRDALAVAPEVSPGGMRLGVERLGSGFRSALTFGTQFAPGRYDGAALVQRFEFDTGCGCFRYTGKRRSAE